MQQNQSEFTRKVKAEYQNLLRQFNHLLDIPEQEKNRIVKEFQTLAGLANININILSIFEVDDTEFFNLFKMTISELNSYFDKNLPNDLKNLENDEDILDLQRAKENLITAAEFTKLYIIQYQNTHPISFHKFESDSNCNPDKMPHSNINISSKEEKQIIDELETLKDILETAFQKDIDLSRALIFSLPEDHSDFFSLFRMSEAEMHQALDEYLEEDLVNIPEEFPDNNAREIQEEVLSIIAIFKVYIKEYWHNLDNTAKKTTSSSIANNRNTFSNNNNNNYHEEDEITYARNFFDQLQL